MQLARRCPRPLIKGTLMAQYHLEFCNAAFLIRKVCVCVCVCARARVCVCVTFLIKKVWRRKTGRRSSAVDRRLLHVRVCIGM